jgi:hypothetical protein
MIARDVPAVLGEIADRIAEHQGPVGTRSSLAMLRPAAVVAALATEATAVAREGMHKCDVLGEQHMLDALHNPVPEVAGDFPSLFPVVLLCKL